MKNVNLQLFAALIPCFLLLSSCSSDNGLRKFNDGDISKELSSAVASKFEVKDVSTLDTSATPTPAPVASKAKKKNSKGGAVVENKGPAIPPMRRPDVLPFEDGERLFYDIRFVGVTAATFSLEMQPFKVVNNRKVFHLNGHAKTVKFFEMVYRVNDEIESFWDYDGLYSHRFTMNLDETKQSRKLIELYDYERNKSLYWNRIDHTERGFSEQKEEFDIKPWSQDPLSLLYYIRVAKLPQNPGESLRIPVILDGKSWEAVLTFERKQAMSIGSKNFNSNVYKLENFQNGELKNKDNTVWISDDDKHYILRIEAKLKVGSFAIALDRIL